MTGRFAAPTAVDLPPTALTITVAGEHGASVQDVAAHAPDGGSVLGHCGGRGGDEYGERVAVVVVQSTTSETLEPSVTQAGPPQPPLPRPTRGPGAVAFVLAGDVLLGYLAAVPLALLWNVVGDSLLRPLGWSGDNLFDDGVAVPLFLGVLFLSPFIALSIVSHAALWTPARSVPDDAAPPPTARRRNRRFPTVAGVVLFLSPTVAFMALPALWEAIGWTRLLH